VINQVFEIRAIAVSYEAAGGTGTCELYTDLPGGAMALRDSMNLPVTSGGRGTASETYNFVATTYKVKFTPNAAGILKPYDGTLQVRRIGLYLDGTRGEFWESSDIAIAI
jgi:hypothetical protein